MLKIALAACAALALAGTAFASALTQSEDSTKMRGYQSDDRPSAEPSD